MTEKNIFVYKVFLLLSISDFSLFLCKNCNPHEEGGSTKAERGGGGGAHTITMCLDPMTHYENVPKF